MVHGDAAVTILLAELPQALHVLLPWHVGSTGSELEAQLCQLLHFDSIKYSTFTRFAGNELVVHAALGGDPMG